MTHPDESRKGGPHDDVARNIRAQQQADAMPTKEAAMADHRRHLREEGCAECDETDPDNLGLRQSTFPSCSAVQKPRDPTYVMCDECYADRPSLRERAFKKANKRNQQSDFDKKVVGVVFYECGNWSYPTAERMTDSERGPVYEDAHPHWTPTGKLRCRCGADITEYVPLSEWTPTDDEDDEDESDGRFVSDLSQHDIGDEVEVVGTVEQHPNAGYVWVVSGDTDYPSSLSVDVSKIDRGFADVDRGVFEGLHRVADVNYDERGEPIRHYELVASEFRELGESADANGGGE